MEETVQEEVNLFPEIQQGTIEELLGQTDRQYQSGFNWIRSKLNTKLEERELYVKEASKDKINIHSIYLQMQMLLALYYQDKTVVRFAGRSIFTEELADNITKVAEFDAEQMDLDTIDYDVEFDRFYTGVGVRVLEGWNNELKVPFARHIDSLSVIPDPNGGYRAKNHSFIGFTLKMSKDDMRQKGYKNIEKI